MVIIWNIYFPDLLILIFFINRISFIIKLRPDKNAQPSVKKVISQILLKEFVKFSSDH